jgi:hypothetical protein
MTTTDIVLRINEALRTGDQLDLENLSNYIDGLLMADTEKSAWLALIETASDSIDGAFR